MSRSKRFGKVDLLFNNAGVYISKAFYRLERDRLELVYFCQPAGLHQGRRMRFTRAWQNKKVAERSF